MKPLELDTWSGMSVGVRCVTSGVFRLLTFDLILKK